MNDQEHYKSDQKAQHKTSMKSTFQTNVRSQCKKQDGEKADVWDWKQVHGGTQKRLADDSQRSDKDGFVIVLKSSLQGMRGFDVEALKRDLNRFRVFSVPIIEVIA